MNAVNKSLYNRILLYFLSSVIISMIIILTISYFIVKNNTENLVIQNLNSNIKQLYDIVENGYDDFRLQLITIADNNLRICEAVYKKNPGAKNQLADIILAQKIGKMGYIYTTDSEGIVRVHPKQALVGESQARFDFVREAAKLKSGTLEYLWANPGEKEPRAKMIGISYFKPYDWVISVSAYLEEFVNKFSPESTSLNFISLKKRIKDLNIGENGYAFVVNSRGNLIVHKNLSEGEDISKYGFVQEILKEREGIKTYYWGGKKKIVAYRYFRPLDWIVAASANYDDFLDRPMNTVKLTSAAMLGILAILMFFVFRRILRTTIVEPVNKVRQIAESLSEGDYTLDIRTDQDDEMGDMIRSISRMVSGQRNISLALSDFANRLAHSSDEMGGISGRISAMSQDQAASMEEAAASLEENLASMEVITDRSEKQNIDVDKNAERMSVMASDAQTSYGESLQVSELVSRTSAEAKKSEIDLNRMVEEMQNIKDSTSRIAEIIEIISDISDQVNLLSLNAAIEAARAGDHGRGFAIVADEISKLAEQTAASAKTITNLVKEGNARVDRGSEIVERTAKTFQEIIHSIDIVTGNIVKFSQTMKSLADTSFEARKNTDSIKMVSNEITISTRDQMKTNKEVSSTIEKINQSTQDLVACADSIQSTSEEIRTLSSSIKGKLSIFKL